MLEKQGASCVVEHSAAMPKELCNRDSRTVNSSLENVNAPTDFAGQMGAQTGVKGKSSLLDEEQDQSGGEGLCDAGSTESR